MKIPTTVLLRDARETVVDGIIERRHIVTRQDLRNIMRDFKLKRSEQTHDNDAISVDAIVKSYSSKPNSPVILYKRQYESTIDIGPDDADVNSCANDDFLLALMNDAQCQMLQQYGSGDLSVVCIDSTHGTNYYQISTHHSHGIQC